MQGQGSLVVWEDAEWKLHKQGWQKDLYPSDESGGD